MDGDGCFYLMAYVTEGAGSTPHLCKFDAEGSLLYDADISGETDSQIISVGGCPVIGQEAVLHAGNQNGTVPFRPDILDIADLDLKALASKGLFVDLNEYLEPIGHQLVQSPTEALPYFPAPSEHRLHGKA